ncbi:hypothetical protein AB834_06170 [PVC group bacterium (ex Bugula neritina AB1)]|nr:hypothetical protein AB834_06170 [PVC group bacterium (ex Bugula neritina AB1)]
MGAGSFGFYIAERLIQEDHDIVVIDIKNSILKKFEKTYDVLTVRGNGASAEVLIEAGIEQADMLLALSNSDEANIVACTMAKYYGVSKKIARITNNVEMYFPLRSEEYLSRMGIDCIVNPEYSCALDFYNSIMSMGITEQVNFAGGEVTLGGLRIPKNCPLVKIPLKEFKGIEDSEIRFVAFSRAGNVSIPCGDDFFEEGDEVFFICTRESSFSIMDFFKIESCLPKKVVIAGGNAIGFHLAQMLEKEKIEVKLIEKNEDKAAQVSDHLSKTIVFHGSSTEPELLGQLDLPDVDAFVAVTDNDENNILSCVLTKQMLVKKSYCLVQKSEYLDILPTMMKIDGVFDVKPVVINTIVKFLRKSSVASVATLHHINADVVEIIVDEDSKVLNKKISNLKFPSGAIIGAVIQDGKVVFAKGSQMISLGDRLIVFYLPHTQKKINAIFGKRIF